MTDKISDLIQWKIVPLPTGYVCWTVVEDDKGVQEIIEPEPIVGWMVQQLKRDDGKTFFWWGKPVVISMFDTDDVNWIVQFPDGKVLLPEDRMCESLDEVREYLKKPK